MAVAQLRRCFAFVGGLNQSHSLARTGRRRWSRC